MEIIDYLLARKKAEASAPTVEQLTATENGTYSEQGIAYSPVVVNVPAPANSYQLKNLPSGTVSTIDDGTALPMPSLKVGIEPVQDLHGYDHPWAGGAGKNKINLADIATPSAGFVYNREPINLAVNTYTLSFNFTGSSGSISISLRNGETVVSTLQDQPLVNGLNTFTMPTLSNNADSISLYAGIGGTYKNFMLEVGSQATTYEPYSNICPISGWTAANVMRSGKNLWGGEKLADDIVAKVPNATKDATNKTVSYSASYVEDKILFTAFKPNTRYTFYMKSSSSTTNLYFYYTDGTKGYLLPNTVVTSDSGKSVDYIQGYWATGNTTLNYEDCGVFEGVLTTQDFEPYSGQTYTIEFKDGDNPLTVYGGTLDVTTGELVVDRAMVDLGSAEWGILDNVDGVYRYRAIINNMKTKEPRSMDIVCSCYETNIDSSAYYKDGTIYNLTTPNRIMIITSLYSNVTDFQNSLSGQTAVYELAEPITYHLTPTQVRTLVGNNNIWADTGDIIEGKYFKSLT